MHKALKTILRQFNYGGKISPKYYSRMGMMMNRYGKETMLEASEELSKSNFKDLNLTHLLNTIEKSCQHILRKTPDEIDWEKI